MLQSFFLFCSGVDQKILEQCPSDVNKYVGIGATVFFTGVLAFFSSAYALFTIFDTYVAAVLFGIIWGLMIFNLDRYIVSSMKSRGSVWKDFGVAFPRLILAILLALVISKPLELKIFEKEINAELIVMEQQKFKEQEDKVNLRYQAQINAWSSEVATLKSEIKAKVDARDTLALMALQEADGTGGSKKKNLGPIYRAKKAKADAAQQELDDLEAIYIPLIAEKEQSIQETKDAVKSEIAGLQRTAFGGIAARMEALDRLGQQSSAIYFANIFIILLFIAIETAPIFVKLIASRSPYDYLLHEHEHVFEMANRERTTILSNSIRNTIMFDTEVGVHRANAKVKVEKAVIDEKLRQRLQEIQQGNLSVDDTISI
jgi:hypothetical protein